MTGDRRLALLLTLWWALAVLPGVLLAAVGGLNLYGSVTGPIVLVWIVGYLAQLGAFMAASRATGRDNMLGWFIASLAPFAVDWSAPFAMLYPLLVALALAGYAWWMYHASAARKDLEQHGIPAVGVVLSVKDPVMNTIINGAYIRRTMQLRVERSDGTPPYEAKHSGTFMIGNIPSPGDRFNLRVDPTDPNRFEVVDGDAPVPSASSFAPQDWGSFTAPQDDSVANDLQKLADLHAGGQLTDAEFAAAKARLLGG